MIQTSQEIDMQEVLSKLGIDKVNNGASTGLDWINTNGAVIESYSPVDGKLIASVKSAGVSDYEAVIKKSQDAFVEWRKITSPKEERLLDN